MPDAIFRHEGGVIDYVPSSNVAAGDVVVLGGVAFVANTPILAGRLGALSTFGVFDFTKQSGVTFAPGDLAYWDVTNRYANKQPSGVYLGIVVRAAAANDATVRVLLDSIVNSLGVGSLFTIPDASIGLPMFIRKLATAGAAGDVTVLSPVPRKLRVVDAWMVARDTNAASIKLHSGTAGTDDITNSVSKGTTLNAIVRFGQIIQAKEEVAAGGVIRAYFSGAGSVEIYILAIPVS